MIIHQDITTLTRGVIVHQVNRQGVWSSTISQLLRRQWPAAYEVYLQSCFNQELELGNLLVVEMTPELFIVNLLAQLDYDPKKPNKPVTSKAAHQKAWPVVKELSIRTGLPVYVPWRIGCGPERGDWSYLRGFIETTARPIWIKPRENFQRKSK